MNDILAITADPQSDDVLISELAGSNADRVTVLLPGCRPESDAESSHRLAELVAKVEFVTGATVVGVAGAPDVVERDDYDRVIHAGAPSQPSLLSRIGIRLERSGATRTPVPALR